MTTADIPLLRKVYDTLVRDLEAEQDAREKRVLSLAAEIVGRIITSMEVPQHDRH